MAIWEFAPGSPWNAIFFGLVMPPCISRSAFRQCRRFEVPAVFAASPPQELQIEKRHRKPIFAGAPLVSEVRTGGPQGFTNFGNGALVSGGQFRDRPAYRPRAVRYPRWCRRSAIPPRAPEAAPVSPAVPGETGEASRNAPAPRGDRRRGQRGGSAARRPRGRWRG